MVNQENQPQPRGGLERIRQIAARQRKEERLKELAIRQREELARSVEERSKNLCRICGNTVALIVDKSEKIANDGIIIKDMLTRGKRQIRLNPEGKPSDTGLLFTVDDLEARIRLNKLNVEENWQRYLRCCREGKII